jgi:ABC-type amino acid transport substrate-binding protein
MRRLLPPANTIIRLFVLSIPKAMRMVFSCELLRAAALAIGREVTFRAGPWSEVRGWLENGEVQALPLSAAHRKAKPFFDFTFAYMSLHGAIVVRTGTKGIYTLEDCGSKRVAVMKGDNPRIPAARRAWKWKSSQRLRLMTPCATFPAANTTRL